MKNLLRFALFAVTLWLASSAAPTVASAACSGTAIHGGSGHACYAISAGAWNTNGTWSATSGGGSCACVPTTGDDLVFDTNSPAGTYTAETISLNSFDASALTHSVTFSATVTLTITGTYFHGGPAANVTWSVAPALTFTNTTGTAVTIFDGSGSPSASSGTTYGQITMNGAGGNFVPQDALFSNAGLSVTAGTYDMSVNNTNLSLSGGSFTESASTTIKCGSGTINLNGPSGTLLNFLATSAVTCGSGTLNIANASPSTTSQRALSFGAYAWGTVNVSGGVTSPTVAVLFTITTNSTSFSSLNLTCPQVLAINGTTTLTLSNAPTWAGTSSGPCGVYSTGIGTGAVANAQAVIAVPGTTNITWTNLLGIKFTGATVNATNSIDLGLNSGATITPPSVGGGGRCIGC